MPETQDPSQVLLSVRQPVRKVFYDFVTKAPRDRAHLNHAHIFDEMTHEERLAAVRTMTRQEILNATKPSVFDGENFIQFFEGFAHFLLHHLKRACLDRDELAGLMFAISDDLRVCHERVQHCLELVREAKATMAQANSARGEDTDGRAVPAAAAEKPEEPEESEESG